MNVKTSHIHHRQQKMKNEFTSFFLYMRPSLRQPTAPVTCKVALGIGLSVGYLNICKEQKQKIKEFSICYAK